MAPDGSDSRDEKGRPQRPNEQDQSAGPSAAEARHRNIQVAAYYTAEKRGFAGDRAVEDWLEAERQIDARSSEAGVKHELSVTTEPPGGASQDVGAGALVAAPDRERIEPAEVKRWAAELNVSAPRLRDAIKNVGPLVDDVKRYLENSRT